MLSPMRRYVFAGNWKMNKTVSEAVALARALREGLEKEPTPHEVVVMPPFTALAELQRRGLIRHLGVSNATSSQVRVIRAA